MKDKVKCYSVRIKSLESISEKAYKATGFDGSIAILPKSQVFGQDMDVQKSDAFWISAWILRNIGMDADELLRLKQITGLAELFKDRHFSKSMEEKLH